jgi:phthalate 4,5-cis-dihydrodiol dehydrogenase
MTERVLRLGVAGLGKAFMLMLPGLVAHPSVKLVAAADPRAEARARFAAEFGTNTYQDVEALAADPGVQAIYVASPHEFHATHVRIAAAHGKHVLVEKPMALTREDCGTMIEAVHKAGVHMVVGHSHSFDAPIARTRALIESGEFGRLRMITALNFTDFLYRPRRPEELRTEAGGGVIYNQAPHHVDIVRLLAGARMPPYSPLTTELLPQSFIAVTPISTVTNSWIGLPRAVIRKAPPILRPRAPLFWKPPAHRTNAC